MNLDKVIDKIQDLIKDSTTDDMLTRLNIQEQISGYLIFLQEEEYRYLQEYKVAYSNRRIGEAEFIDNSEESITRAKEIAPFRMKDLRDKEVQMEVAFEKLRGFRLAVKTHLESMKQKTSYLRYELELMKQS